MSGNDKKTIVISNGTMIDGTGNSPSRNEAIVIQGSRIKSTGRLPGDIRLEDSDNVEVINATGQWIMPGLIDAHTHLSYGNPRVPGEARGRGTTRPEFNTLRAARNAQIVLRSGVTSISVPGGTWFTDVAVRDAIKLGLIEGPRVYCAGRMIVTYGSIEDEEPSWVGSPEHSIGVLCNTAADMVTEVRRQCKHGVDFIKMADSRSGETQTIAKEEIAAVVQEAHRRNARVAIHSRGSASTRAAAEAGVDWIMHTDLATEADLEAVAKAGVRIVPTATFVARVLEIGREVGQEQIQIDLDRMKRNMDGLVNVLERARALGIKVMCGTDTGNYSWMPYGKTHAKEAEILVRYGGYTPIEAITACTRDNAFAVGLENEVGALETGKLADIVILKQNPLADIRVLQDPANLAIVIKDGKKVNLENHSLEEAPLIFQEAVA
ncbi:MAG: amidohydrolase family protein [Deltaproteobacteria bacterium]|nr:MAG: amidohydrolase family protein [Deltaproteobacteria bacterium]